jgi:hypothetical protein
MNTPVPCVSGWSATSTSAGTCGFDHLLPARAAAIRFSFSSVAITVIS